MANNNRGQHPNSKANLLKGMAPPKMMIADVPSQRLANAILDEEIEYEGEMMTTREAILRNQVRKALDEGDLRSCQFLIELAGRNEQNAQIKTAVTTRLEKLQAMMQQSHVDDRRKKAT